MNPIQLGDRASDRISGLSGVVVGKTQWLFGCVRLGLQPTELHEGKLPEIVWFDEGQLTLSESGVCLPPQAGAPANPGGPRPDPQRRRDPQR